MNDRKSVGKFIQKQMENNSSNGYSGGSPNSTSFSALPGQMNTDRNNRRPDVVEIQVNKNMRKDR